MQKRHSVLELAVQAGEILLENGAEVFRVQQTMEIIAAAYGAEEFHVYVLTNGIFASMAEDGVNHVARLENVPQASVHLGRIDGVNTLSRQIAQGNVPMEQAFDELDRIRAIPVLSLPLQMLACGAGSAFFALLFGGKWPDFFCAFAAGLLLHVYLWRAEKNKTNKIITRLMGAALVTAVASVCMVVGVGNDMDKIIIGSIMPLVPGIALTMAIRDFFNSDYLSGTIRLIDALIIGLSIATGVGAVLGFASMVLGVQL